MTAECPQCGTEFEKLGTHWSRGSCDYPKPSSEFQEVLTGIYMGDGNLATHHSNNPYMRLNNVNKVFLEYLDSKLGWLTTGVRLKKTADQSAQQRLERDEDGWTVNPENYNAIYGTRTRRLPYFRKYEQWTSTGQKRYPDSLELTPTIAKFWYVSDGTINWMRKYSARLVFACRNEQDRPDFIQDLFVKAGFEVKPNKHMFYLDVEESSRFLQWLGSPVPGFEYKWEIESRKRYDKLLKQK